MAVLLILSTVTGCTKKKEEKPEDDYSINYLVLVNKLNPLPENWEKEIRTENFINSVGMNVEVETKAYQAYLQLKQELENEGVYIDLDSARRSIEEQQQIMDEFSEEYGADYFSRLNAYITANGLHYDYGYYDGDATVKYAEAIKSIFGDDVFTKFGSWCVANNHLQE